MQRFHHLPDAVSRMVRDSTLSPRQAYRYLQQARGLKQPLPVSDTKVAFTAKLFRKLDEDETRAAQGQFLEALMTSGPIQ